MNFPDVYQILSDGFQIDPTDGLEADYAMDGTPRFRRLYSRTRYAIRFVIGPLTPSDKQAVIQFYHSYRSEYLGWEDPFTGEQYEILLADPPRVVRYDGPNVCAMEITAEGYMSE